MRLSELLDANVVDISGQEIGPVRDFHLVQDGPTRSSGQAAFRVHGFVAGRRAACYRLGYDMREGIDPGAIPRGPFVVRWFARILDRNARYIPWTAVRRVEPGRITVALKPPVE
jgi:hypothetical protein